MNDAFLSFYNKWIKNKFAFFFALFLLGIALSVQFRSIYLSKQNSTFTLSAEKLRADIKSLTAYENELKAGIEENLKKREEFLKSYFSTNNDNQLKLEWEQARLKAGLTDVKGDGIIIKVDDAFERKSEDLSSLIVHDSDIRVIINDLKKAGAQAISINNERIIASSEQVCAGPTIRINAVRCAVPFVINVIGNPDELYDQFSKSERVALMIRDGIQISFKKAVDIFIPAYTNPERETSLLEAVNDENK